MTPALAGQAARATTRLLHAGMEHGEDAQILSGRRAQTGQPRGLDLKPHDIR
jgi:hypothetical protein